MIFIISLSHLLFTLIPPIFSCTRIFCIWGIILVLFSALGGFYFGLFACVPLGLASGVGSSSVCTWALTSIWSCGVPSLSHLGNFSITISLPSDWTSLVWLKLFFGLPTTYAVVSPYYASSDSLGGLFFRSTKPIGGYLLAVVKGTVAVLPSV